MTKEQINEALELLPNKNKVLITLKYGDNETVVRLAHDVRVHDTGYGDSYLRFRDIAYGGDYCPARRVISLTDGTDYISVPEAPCTFGSDPEFFFVDKKNEVVASTEVIPDHVPDKVVTPDGFQGELNPDTSACRQVAANHISYALQLASEYARDTNTSICFDIARIIGDDTWNNTPTSSRRFGCNPTMNAQESRKLSINGMRQRFRSAGGHVHIGIPNWKNYNRAKTERLIKLMDILGGNLAVLIDRHKDNARRRKYYGRAGEYREKKYGVEYRVFSNFWLKHYTLWSFVSGQLRNAVSINANDELADKMLAEFQSSRIKLAINNNDYDLALLNANKLMEFYEKHHIMHSTGLDCNNFHLFMRWAITEDPLKFLDYGIARKVDDDTILGHWVDLIPADTEGIERFLIKFI